MTIFTEPKVSALDELQNIKISGIKLMCLLHIVFFYLTPIISLAAGNYPEAGACAHDKPYFAICTHSLHSLEGWYGNNCHTTQEKAQNDADEHAEKYHQGNSRWTGISKQHPAGYK